MQEKFSLFVCCKHAYVMLRVIYLDIFLCLYTICCETLKDYAAMLLFATVGLSTMLNALQKFSSVLPEQYHTIPKTIIIATKEKQLYKILGRICFKLSNKFYEKPLNTRHMCSCKHPVKVCNANAKGKGYIFFRHAFRLTVSFVSSSNLIMIRLLFSVIFL